jgi:F0F1-type ATP synthase membrane subunit b/b'
MLAFVTTFLLLFAETAKRTEGGFTQFYDRYFNIPGFELWKFINLALFIAFMLWASKKLGVSEAFKAKRDAIRAELIRAEQEKQSATAKLTAAEGKLAQLPTEKENILANAKEEAALEKKRLSEQTKSDIARLKAQAEADLTRLAVQQRNELRRFSAEVSVRKAEEKLRSAIDGNTDARLVKASIAEIGGLN